MAGTPGYKLDSFYFNHVNLFKFCFANKKSHGDTLQFHSPLHGWVISYYVPLTYAAGPDGQTGTAYPAAGPIVAGNVYFPVSEVVTAAQHSTLALCGRLCKH